MGIYEKSTPQVRTNACIGGLGTCPPEVVTGSLCEEADRAIGP